jgi:hypothetical protein
MLSEVGLSLIRQNGTSWQWSNQGMPQNIVFDQEVSAVAVGNRPYAFVLGHDPRGPGAPDDRHLWMNWWDGTSWKWSDQGNPGPGRLFDWYEGISAVAANSRPYAFIRGSLDEHLWMNWWDGTSWQWSDQGTPPGRRVLAGALDAVTAGNRTYVFTECDDAHVWVNWLDEQGSWHWSDQGSPPSGPPGSGGSARSPSTTGPTHSSKTTPGTCG